ncbi:MAG: ABC transporter permease [Acidobacteriota bacterium]
MSDFRLALRQLRLHPGYAAAVILTLALGIGANTAIFSVIHGVLLEPLPYADGDELVVLRQWADDAPEIPMSIAEFFDYRDASRSLDLVEYHSMNFTLLGQQAPVRVSTGVVSHDFFDVLGVEPRLGRFFRADDERHGAEAVLILSHGFWRSRFGGQEDVVGQVFEMNNRPHTVVGILPPIPQFPNDHDVYMPTSACPFRAAGAEAIHEDRSAFRNLTVFGRLRDGAGLDTARAEARGIAERFFGAHPETYGQIQDFGVKAAPLRDEITREARPMLLVLLGTTGLILMLACFNVANLTLARQMRRRRELAVRAALGAERWGLVKGPLGESTLLALQGGVLGVAVAAGSLDLLENFLGGLSPRIAQIELDLPVLLFALGLSLVTGLGFGGAPLLANRSALTGDLRDGGRGTAGGRSRVRGLFVAAQVAVSTVLLITAGLLLRSFDKLQSVDPGFATENVLTARLALNWTKYDSPEKTLDFFSRILDKLQAHPAVTHAAVGSAAPLTQGGMMSQDFRIENADDSRGGPDPTLDLAFVSESYFDALSIPLVRGRLFDGRDQAEAPDVAVVSRTFADRHFPGGDPVGRRLLFGDDDAALEIIGVVGDVRQLGLDRRANDLLYRPIRQTGFSNRIVVRTRADPGSMARDVAAAVRAVDPQQPVERIETLEATRSESLETPRTTTLLLSLFAALALAITVMGVTGVVAWSVAQRTREIGLRMALGARRPQVLGLIVRQGLTLVVAGAAVGLVGAFFFTRLLVS